MEFHALYVQSKVELALQMLSWEKTVAPPAIIVRGDSRLNNFSLKKLKSGLKKLRPTTCDMEDERLFEELAQLAGKSHDDFDKLCEEHAEEDATDKQRLMRTARKHCIKANSNGRTAYDFKQGGEDGLHYLTLRRGTAGIEIEELLTEYCLMFHTTEKALPNCKKSTTPCVELAALLVKDPSRFVVKRSDTTIHVASRLLQPSTTTIPEDLYLKTTTNGHLKLQSKSTPGGKPVSSTFLQQAGFKFWSVPEGAEENFLAVGPGLLSGVEHPGLLSGASDDDRAVIKSHTEMMRRVGEKDVGGYPAWLRWVVQCLATGEQVDKAGEVGVAVLGMALRRLLPQIVLEEERLKIMEVVLGWGVPKEVREVVGVVDNPLLCKNLMKLVLAGLHMTYQKGEKESSPAEELIAHILAITRAPLPQDNIQDVVLDSIAAPNEATHLQNTQPHNVTDSKLPSLYGTILDNVGRGVLDECLPTVAPFGVYIVPEVRDATVPPFFGETVLSDVKISKLKLKATGETPVSRAVQKVLHSWGPTHTRYYSLPHRDGGRKIIFPDIPVSSDYSRRMVEGICLVLGTWYMDNSKLQGLGFRNKTCFPDLVDKLRAMITPVERTTPLPFTSLQGPRPDQDSTPRELLPLPWNTVRHVDPSGHLIPFTHTTDLMHDMSMRKFAHNPPTPFTIPPSVDPLVVGPV